MKNIQAEDNRLVREGSLLKDEEKETRVLRYAYHLAQSNNNLPRAYYVGMILRDRLISEIERHQEKLRVWGRFKIRRLTKKLSRLEDELYILNHLHPGHFVPFEKYDFMQKREEEGDKLLEETVGKYLE